jgi:hypothetical protein
MITPREKRSLEKNRRRFDTLVRALDSSAIKGDEEAILVLIQRAVNFAVQNDTGCFCSPEIETKLCEIAQSLPEHYEKNPLPAGTILHVMTTAYRSGGHTRMVERWIANSPPEEIHSVVLISQEPMHFPSLLEELVTAHGGRLLQLPPVSQKEKGAILRSLSYGATKVILHVHMYDPVPNLAYGTSSFTVPVIFFNHADHLFWIGASITDLCADMSRWRCDFSRRRRGISQTCLLPIPTDDGFAPISREVARRALGIEPEARVIVTSAQEYKYGRYRELDFFSFLLRITIGHPERIVFAIGPSKGHPLWELLQTASAGRISPCGQIPYQDIGAYLCAADLFVESFPFPSFTSLLDVANLDIPTLSLRLPLPHLDSIEASMTICPTIDDLCHRIDAALLYTPSTTLMINAINRDHRREGWLTHLKALYNACPTIHQITKIQASSLDRSIGELEAYLHNLKVNLRGDHATLLKRQVTLLFELLRLMFHFSLFDASGQLVLWHHLRKSVGLLLSTFPKIASKLLGRKRKCERRLNEVSWKEE